MKNLIKLIAALAVLAGAVAAILKYSDKLKDLLCSCGCCKCGKTEEPETLAEVTEEPTAEPETTEEPVAEAVEETPVEETPAEETPVEEPAVETVLDAEEITPEDFAD